LCSKETKPKRWHHKSRGFKEKYDKEAQELALRKKRKDHGGLNHLSG
jgi:hypothetical protein